jgi:hypothetical protein
VKTIVRSSSAYKLFITESRNLKAAHSPNLFFQEISNMPQKGGTQKYRQQLQTIQHCREAA